MQLGLPSHDRLSFDPLKPIILRGSPDDDAKSVFSGNVVLSLSKPTKITSVAVTLKSTANTYWPEGIGARGTRLASEKTLSEETLCIFRKKSGTTFVAGVHRFPFAFLVPSSVVETIEDFYGRVRHTVEARATRAGISLLNNLTASETVLVLRTYMSNSLLTNNSLQDLSRTLEKHTIPADIQVIVEQAAFSPGEVFHIRAIVQPQKKHVRLEHMDISVLESRRYCEPDLRATRTDSTVFPLRFRYGKRLLNDTEPSNNSTHEVAKLFDKTQPGIDLLDTFAHRLSLATPTCHDNVHHTTHFKDILFRHYLCINITLSYLDDNAVTMHRNSSIGGSRDASILNNGASRYNARHSADATLSAQSQQWHSMFFKFGKKSEKTGPDAARKRESVQFELPVSVFDCRLKEDFSVLPSYFELYNPVPEVSPIKNGSPSRNDKGKTYAASENDDAATEPSVYLCDCYHQFAHQMQYASQAPFLVTTTSRPPSPSLALERVPSKPPPEYGVSP